MRFDTEQKTGVDLAADTYQKEDPVVTAFLAFLEQDMKTHPKRIAGLSKRAIARATRLSKGVKVTDDERLPEDITFY